MKRLIAMCAACAACASSGAANGGRASSESVEGVYEFSASVPTWQPGSSVQVKGTLSAFDDSLWIQTGPECGRLTLAERYRTPSTDRISQINCQGVTLTFEKTNPTAAKWYSRVQVPKQRNTCVEYEPRTAAGGNRPRCRRYKPETYYEPQQRSGAVQVKRIS